MNKITLDLHQEIDGFDMARMLNYTGNKKIRDGWINEFLSQLNDESYASVCTFCMENPPVMKDGKPV